MPYECVLEGRKWHLNKKDGGKTLGMHDTKRECNQQMRAIYANELKHPKNIVIDGYFRKPFDFDEKLKNSDDVIDIVVNVPDGGEFLDAIEMHQSLRNSGKQINIHVNPIAVSAGAVFALAGDKVYMPENGVLMFHTPKMISSEMKSADDLEKSANALRTMETMLVNTLMSKTKKSQEECEKIMRNDTWLTAEEAKNMGIVDEIVPIYRDVQIQNYFPERIVNFLEEKKKMPLQEIFDTVGVKSEAELIQLIADLRKNQQKPAPSPPSDNLVNMVLNARQTTLNNLFENGKMVKPVLDELMKDHCTKEAIIADEAIGSTTFDKIVNSYNKNEAIVSFKGKTPAQTRKLPDGTSDTKPEDDESMAEKRMKKRAEEAKARGY